MSWSVDFTGPKDGVKARVHDHMVKLAEQYEGKPESDDILAACERILDLIDVVDFQDDVYGGSWNAVKVTASGSHGCTDKGITTASTSFSVTRVSLAL